MGERARLERVKQASESRCRLVSCPALSVPREWKCKKSKNVVVAIVCRKRRDEGRVSLKKQTRRGNPMCNGMIDHGGEKEAAMPSSNNIIVFRDVPRVLSRHKPVP